jgi:pyruvate/2-oxoglutarate dehydrogenase complex dihydrolipoamide acyltransferase (E2) component
MITVAEFLRMYWARPGDYMLRLMSAMVHAWYDPAENSRILCRHMDLGVAVDTEGGLLVPVLRNIDSKSAAELQAAILGAGKVRRDAAVIEDLETPE